MLHWFEKKAPIYVKFSALLITYTTIAALAFAASLLSRLGWIDNVVAVAASAASVLATAAVGIISRDRVCRPYVNTVVRMEGLAAGDLESEIRYTDYQDCVGRMTHAMRTFRANAIEVAASREAQEIVVSSLRKALTTLAGNRLDCRIGSPFPGEYDALRQDFNRAVEALASAISAVDQTSSSVLTGASEIHHASDDLSQRNEQQASNLEQTSATLNQITSRLSEAAVAASEARKSIADTHREATEGGAVVESAVRAMVEIEQSAHRIGQIVDVIDGIAFQTNLLALNAGVEAARAGDAGKGFAVVANEVRALAQRSADAAKDIGSLISESTQQVSTGVRLVGDTGALLSRILARIGAINTAVDGMAVSTQEQADSLGKVNSAVAELDRVTQQNAAMVEQSTAAARSLSDEAQQLTDVVRKFDLGTLAAPAPAVVPIARTATVRSTPPRVVGNTVLSEPAWDPDWSEF
jgi:methyl-accepting chemotaxis protein